MSARVKQWAPLANAEIGRQGSPVPVELVLGIIEAESTGVPGALRGEAHLGDASIGLMQILLSTARQLGYQGVAGDRNTLTGLFEPRTNIRLGVQLLTDLWNRLGNAAGVASAYNGGVRPSLGFGLPLTGTVPKSICLAWEGSGASKRCVKSVTVQPGQYANAAYIQKVLTAMRSYTSAQQLPPVIIDGSDDAPSGDMDGGTGSGPDDATGTSGSAPIDPAVLTIALAVLGASAVAFFRR